MRAAALALLLWGLTLGSGQAQNAINVGGIALGVTNGSNAAPGTVGEVFRSQVLAGSAVSLSSNVAANITSIALTAGDWDVYANASYTITVTTASQYTAAAISTTSVTLPDSSLYSNLGNIVAGQPFSPLAMSVPSVRVNVSSPTTVYLVTQTGLTAGTMAGFGQLWARRRR